MNKEFMSASAKILESVAQAVKEGKTSMQDACMFLNTAARFEERTNAEEKDSPRQ